MAYSVWFQLYAISYQPWLISRLASEIFLSNCNQSLSIKTPSRLALTILPNILARTDRLMRQPYKDIKFVTIGAVEGHSIKLTQVLVDAAVLAPTLRTSGRTEKRLKVFGDFPFC